MNFRSFLPVALLSIVSCGPPGEARSGSDVESTEHRHRGDDLPPPLPPLQKEDVVVGTGPAVKNGDRVSVHYTGTLLDGTKFDSSLDRGTPLEFTVGKGQVIQGWDLGVVGMQVGGKRKLVIPPHLAYDLHGSPPTIGPNATLKFDIELVSIEADTGTAPPPSPAAPK